MFRLGHVFGRSLSPMQAQPQDSSGEIHLDLSVKEGKCSNLIRSYDLTWFLRDGLIDRDKMQTLHMHMLLLCMSRCEASPRASGTDCLMMPFRMHVNGLQFLDPLIPKVSKSLVPLGIRFQISISFLTQRLGRLSQIPSWNNFPETTFYLCLVSQHGCVVMYAKSIRKCKSSQNPGFSRLSFEWLQGFRRGNNGKQMWMCVSRPSSQITRLRLWHETSFCQRQSMFSGYIIKYGDCYIHFCFFFLALSSAWGADMPGFFEGFLTFGQARIRSSNSVLRARCFRIFRFRARSTRSLKSGSSCVFQAPCVIV